MQGEPGSEPGLAPEPTPDQRSIEERFLEETGMTRRVDLTRQQENILFMMENLEMYIERTAQAEEPEKQTAAFENFFMKAKPNDVLGHSAVDWENPLCTYKPTQETKTTVFPVRSGRFSDRGLYLVHQTKEGESTKKPSQAILDVVIINPKLTEGYDLSRASFALLLDAMLTRRAKFSTGGLSRK